jgi:hypothetical protein
MRKRALSHITAGVMLILGLWPSRLSASDYYYTVLEVEGSVSPPGSLWY